MPILTVRLDDELHRLLRHLSIERRESMQQMTERLLRDFAERETRKPSRRREVKR